VHLVGVSHPPEIKPVSIKLVVGHEHEAMWEIALECAVVHLVELALHAFVAADTNNSRSPPLCDGSDEDCKRLLRPCHVTIVELWVYQLQGSSNEL
jgi:hypothetical protein